MFTMNFLSMTPDAHADPAEFIDSGQSLGCSIGQGVMLGDIDSDDDLDAFVANREPNKVWINITDYYKSNFSDFILNHVVIKFKELSDSDIYYIKGRFTLGENSDGIDPLEDVVKLKVGTSNLEIPAGSFLKMGKRKYKFIGEIGDVRVYMSLKTLKSNAFRFKVWIRGIDLTGTPNPVPIVLYIGDDMGQTDIWLSGILTLK
jgi:hypothetical protein